MLIIDLRWLLLLMLGLPLLAVAATLGIIHRMEQKNRIKELLFNLSPLLQNAPIGIFVAQRGQSQEQKIVHVNSYAQHLFSFDMAQPGSIRELFRLFEMDITIDNGVSGFYRSLETDVALTDDSPKRRLRWWITDWDENKLVFFADTTSQQQNAQRFSLILGRLAHELRTPIETITAHIEVLSLPKVSEEQKNESLAYAKAETQRLAHLSNRSLELVRLGNRLHRDVGLVKLPVLVDEVIGELSVKAQEKEINLRTEYNLSLPEAIGNRELLKQVLINLVGNSLAYCRDGDIVTVALFKDANGVVCVIRDTGPGIASAHLPHLTQPFYRAGSTYSQGIGLGLAIVFEILHQHQSTLTIESVHERETAPGEDSGTTMSFVLPTLAESSRENEQ